MKAPHENGRHVLQFYCYEQAGPLVRLFEPVRERSHMIQSDYDMRD